MRIIIISDLHANLEALRALQSAEQQPDALISLGDVIGYGPDPAACFAWLRSNVTYAVRGDHEHATLTNADFASPPEYRDLAEATRAHTLRQLKPSDLEYLAKWPLSAHVQLGDARFFIAHASPRAPLTGSVDWLTASEDELRLELAGIDADVVFVGHSHIPAIRHIGKMYVVNPGSLGQPRHGLPSATYAMWEDGQVQIKHIDYDPRPTQNKLALMSLEPEIQERLREILERGM